jgi:hypothetical protein
MASKCKIVFACVFDDAALEETFLKYMEGKPQKGSIFIDNSTVSPALTEKLAALAEEKGIAFLGCPIFGRPDAAIAGKSLVVAAGDAAAKAQVGHRFEAAVGILGCCLSIKMLKGGRGINLNPCLSSEQRCPQIPCVTPLQPGTLPVLSCISEYT